MAGCLRRLLFWHRGPWSLYRFLSGLEVNYSVVGMKECFESFNLTPTFEGLNGVSMSNVVRFEQVPELGDVVTRAGR